LPLTLLHTQRHGRALTRPSMKPVDRCKPYGLNLWNVIMDRRVKPGDDEL
jgi:hypothetical protein